MGLGIDGGKERNWNWGKLQIAAGMVPEGLEKGEAESTNNYFAEYEFSL